LKQLSERLEAAHAPVHILAAIEAVQFREPKMKRLANLRGIERRRFFEWCDRRQLSLMLPEVCGSQLPDWVAEELQRKTASYLARYDRLTTELFEIVRAFQEANLEFVMLKGLSHAPALTPEAKWRAQGDIDFWLMGKSVFKARDVLSGLGYVPLLHSKARHLAPMGKPSSWKWRGDLFDSEMPISVELHYELWSDETEHIRAPGVEGFWERKTIRNFNGYDIPVLCDVDLIGFSALHLLIHLLHGELPLQRAWEIARFLETHTKDNQFWTSWEELHPMALRRLETVIFNLVGHWFGSDTHPRSKAESLKAEVQTWLNDCKLAPLTREWRPNKSEIWLHLALIEDSWHKWCVLFRRLIPMSLPGFNDRADLQKSMLTKLFRISPLLASRLVRHVVTFVPTLWDGLRWYVGGR
jgi:hypothetical protein